MAATAHTSNASHSRSSGSRLPGKGQPLPAAGTDTVPQPWFELALSINPARSPRRGLQTLRNRSRSPPPAGTQPVPDTLRHLNTKKPYISGREPEFPQYTHLSHTTPSLRAHGATADAGGLPRPTRSRMESGCPRQWAQDLRSFLGNQVHIVLFT